jgi:hypothetical protein
MRFFVRSSTAEPVERHRRFPDAIVSAVKAARSGGIAIVGDGDASDVDDVIESYEAWRRKYGDEEWSPIPADEVHTLLGEIAEPARLGLEPIRRGLFGRQVGLDIIQLLAFRAYKGYSYGFVWGISLAFVPHEFERRVRFHRTPKSAKFDLFEQAHEEFGRRGGNERDGAVPAGYGADVFRRDGTHAWEFVRPRIEEWWASTTAVEGVLGRAREQMTAAAGFQHWPEPALVEAFALARLGRGDEARKALSNWLVRRGDDFRRTTPENLAAALEKVAAQPR